MGIERRQQLNWIVVCLGLTFICPHTNARVSPVSTNPIVVYDLRYALAIDTRDAAQANRAWDHCHTVATLQGVVNRNAPELYLFYVNAHGRRGPSIDEYWFDKYRTPGTWLADRPTVEVKTVVDLVNRFRDRIKGAVVYDPKVPATSNVASAVAGAQDLVAVRYDPAPGSLYSQLVLSGPKLPVNVQFLNPDGASLFTGSGTIPGTDVPSTGSAKCDAYLWMKHHYLDGGLCNPRYGAYYIDTYWTQKPNATLVNHHTLTNHDYFVSQRAFFFDLSPWADEPATDDPGQTVGTDCRTMKALLLSATQQAGKDAMIHIGGFPPWAFKYTKHAGGRHEDVPTEWEYARIMSAYNAFKDADAIGLGAMANASFWQHFPLQKTYPQPWVTHDELRKKGYLTQDGKVKVDGRDFVIFYVGDYDAASWVYQRVRDIWDDPNRGKVPMMWCISPMIDRRAPMAMDYMRRSASPNDYFAAADNGAGYLNPGMLQVPRGESGLPSGLDAWATHCSTYYQRWGLTVTGFVIDGYAPGLNEAGFNCYQRFSPNGIVPQKVPVAMLHGNMPVLRAGWDVNQGDPREAAKVVLDRIQKRPIPFHWFRNILKSPTWYVQLHGAVKETDPSIEILDCPTFFELLRLYLQQ